MSTHSTLFSIIEHSGSVGIECYSSFETHWRYSVVSLSKTLQFIVLVQPRKTGKCPDMTEKLLNET